MSVSRAPITTHILDLQSGTPAEGVQVTLFAPHGLEIGTISTDSDGRINHWPRSFDLGEGLFQLHFYLEPWFAARGEECFFPTVTLTFKVTPARPHYHVPLLLNRYGYSTYRGS